MEYFGNCPKCNHHTIVKSVKQIHGSTKRLPQRTTKCGHCGATARITIIGQIVKLATTTLNPNAEFATANRLVVHLWS
jgi:transcription elongation factor Elf1